MIWFALLLAQSLGGGLVGLINNLTEAMAHPFHIRWTDRSLVTALVCIAGYVAGMTLMESENSRKRDGEEHGSATWGSPREVNAMFAQKQNKLLTRHVRLGLDTHIHRRSLNVLVIGGSGAGKSRSYVVPNILEANTNYVVTDPKEEVLIKTGGWLKENGYDIRVLNLVNLDIQSIIKALRSEKFLLTAENLSGVSANLINTLAKPPEDKPFSEYARLLIAPERMLAVTQKKLNPELTAPTRRRLRDTSAAAATLCGEKDDMIRYATETENGETMLCATVSNLSEKLGHTMWKQPRPFLLTSGTLAVGRDFRRFRQEAGLNSGYRVKESVSASPFDYQHNCLLYFPEDPPSMRNPNYFEDLTAEILSLLNASHGHALVLFTSYAAMSAVKERLLRENLRWPLFAMSRNAVYTVEQFKRSPGAVLLATGAAWEGFDFPGDAVSMFIIPRLPFPQPNALKEKERKKYDTLKEFIRAVVVPEMQIKLRQGFGRAIRTETDTCAVAILDERAGIGGRYHRDVLSALPQIPQTRHIEAVGSFLREKKSAQYFVEGQEKADSA